MPEPKILQLHHKIITFPYMANYGHPVPWEPNGIHWGEDHQSVYEDDIVLHDGIAIVGDDGTGWGKYLKCRHKDGWETIYAHLDAVYAETGEKLKAGNVAYRTGESGSANNNPHLHLEIRWNGKKYIDTGPKWQQRPDRFYISVEVPPTPTLPPIVNGTEFPLVSNTWIVRSDWLYCRPAPGTDNIPVGTLQYGTKIKAIQGIELYPGSRWIKYNNNGTDVWSAFYHQSLIYLEPIV